MTTYGPITVFAMMVAVLACGVIAGWFLRQGFQQGQLKHKDSDIQALRERSDDASPGMLHEEHHGVRLAPLEHLCAVNHARVDIAAGKDWECPCVVCDRVRAKFVERGRLSIYKQSLRNSIRRSQ